MLATLLLYDCYTFGSLVFAFFLGAAMLVVIVLVDSHFDEFKKLKAQQQNPDVVDAHFVDISKKPTQLNSSQALVRRSTSVERRQR